MESASVRYREMLQEPCVSTPVFHEILGALLSEDPDSDLLDHADGLLHIPIYNSVEWEERVRELTRQNRIPTVTNEEALEATTVEESGVPDWDEVVGRVIEKRRAGVSAIV